MALVKDRIPDCFLSALTLADTSWHDILREGLLAIIKADPAYLNKLAASDYVPTQGRLFAAFAQPLDYVRYVLVGEGPYPRQESATGFSFMDGAVLSLWSAGHTGGLSKQVNRATSLRNFIKMLLVADGKLSADATGNDAMAKVAVSARAIGSPLIQTLSHLQSNLHHQGFLLLNASLVFRADVPPVKDARAWQPFLNVVLTALSTRVKVTPTLVLWGKIAQQLEAVTVLDQFPKIISEHPYNLSFIHNKLMQDLFRPMHLLRR